MSRPDLHGHGKSLAEMVNSAIAQSDYFSEGANLIHWAGSELYSVMRAA
jgi:hypothetical protein